MITMIAAISKNGCIGVGNDLPWKLVGELKYFKKMTEGQTVVMGRKTYESMGSKALPNRHNIVLSKDTSFNAVDCDTIRDFKKIKARDDYIIIGGEQIYREYMSVADKLILTDVDLVVDGDTFFPTFDLGDWNLTQLTETVYYCKIHKKDVTCRHTIYERKKTN